MTTKSDLAASLAEAQKNMKNATMNKINPHFKSKYADLGSIRDAVIPPLAAEGIALVQAIETREFGPVVVTTLRKGGEVISSECPVIVGPKVTAQQFGSALTYARRYSIAAICGIASEEDDDGNSAEKGGATDTPKTTEDAAAGLLRKTNGITQLKNDLRALAKIVPTIDGIGELGDVEEEYQSVLDDAKERLPDWHEAAVESLAKRRGEIGGA